MSRKREPVQTEVIAVSTLNILFGHTDYIRACFATTDKTPLYDGELLIYRDKAFSNEAIIGRVPVQIKGRSVEELSDNRTSISVSKSDLTVYFNDGGVFFFLVEIDSDTNTKIFRNALLPFDIKELLGSKGKKNRKY